MVLKILVGLVLVAALAPDARNADALLGLSGIAAIKGSRASTEHLVKVALARNSDFQSALVARVEPLELERTTDQSEADL